MRERVPVAGRCGPCDKKIFECRKDARRAARVMKGGDLPRPYACPHTPGWWHVGHLPEAVRQGAVSRDLYRSRLPSPSSATRKGLTHD